MVDYLLSSFKWYRKLSGGHWELWFIDAPVEEYLWIKEQHGITPGLGVSLHKCEDYHPVYHSNHPYR